MPFSARQGFFKGAPAAEPTLDIVTSGLLLFLDAANPSSYPGSGNEWYDLSGNNYHMSLKNSPTFNSTDKYFDLDGVDMHGICDGTISGSTAATPGNLGVNGNAAKTIMVVARVSASGSNGGLWDFGSSGVTDQQFCLRSNVGGDNTEFKGQFWGTNDFTFYYSIAGTWQTIAMTYENGDDTRVYFNTTVRGNKGSSVSLATGGVRPLEMGRYNTPTLSFYNAGDIQAYLVYNKELSSTEITQNYNAFAGRGLV